MFGLSRRRCVGVAWTTLNDGVRTDYLLLGLLKLGLLFVAEIFFERATFAEEQLKVGYADDDRTHLRRQREVVALVHDGAIVFCLVEVGESLDEYHTDTAKLHLLDVEVLDSEREEVVACHIVEQLVFADRVAREGEHEHVRLLRVEVKFCRLTIFVHGCGVVAKSSVPEHTALVAAFACLQIASLLETFEHTACHVGHVGCRPFFEQHGESLFEFIVVLLCDITECVDEDEFRQNLR